MTPALTPIELIETAIRERFAVRQERFEHRGLVLHILMPLNAEDLLDEQAFAHDERMPYWADLWPSARALARWLLDQPEETLRGRVIELGCGLALPSLALQSRGVDVLATDYNDDGLLFARCNVLRNNLGELRTEPLDWREPPAALGAFDLILAADVLYEQRNAIALADLLPRIVAPQGRFVLADPGRRWAGEFRCLMRAKRWTEHEACVIEEPALGAGAPSTIRITQWVPASALR